MRRRFGKTGGTVAPHAYQSFRPGEVTPRQCHDIGVELARRVWGGRFQVAGIPDESPALMNST